MPIPLRLETYISGLAAAAIAIHLFLRYGFGAPFPVANLPLILAILAGGIPLIVQLMRSMAAGNFGADLLAGIAIATATFLGEYLVATIVVLMLSGGAALEHFATRRASSVLAALAKRTPQVAHRSLQSSFVDVSLDEIEIGDWLLVLPHEICPVDGTVLEGHATMDESYLTGEPFLIPKTPGSTVLSGSLNGDSALTIAVDRVPSDSRYARIMQVVTAAEQNRPPLRRLADRLGAWYTPLALAIAFASWGLAGHLDRFLAVLVIATPCPLLLAIPVAIIGAISVAGKSGIIIKNPTVLEQADRCRTLIFDKTGTLTYGRPALTAIVTAPGFETEYALRLAAALEQYSKHPLAGAVLRSAEENRLKLPTVRLISEKPGQGLRGLIDDHDVQIAGRNRLDPAGGHVPPWIPPEQSGLECLLFVDHACAALLRFRDEPRQESKPFVSHLAPKHAAQRVLLVSGDRESEVRYLAESVGIKEVFAGQSPEDKLAIVREEAKRAKTMYVGDGINDAPAMLAATAGVAFGRSSDITAEAAGAVLLEPSLAKVDELMHISRRMRRIALESALGGMALSMIGMLAAAAGYLPPVAGAIAQEFIDLAAVLNALRVAIQVPGKTDF